MHREKYFTSSGISITFIQTLEKIIPRKVRSHPELGQVRVVGGKEGCCVSSGVGGAVDFLASIVPTGSLLVVRGGKSGGGQHGGKELGRGVEEHSAESQS
jgi:hypothetical protein